MSDYHTGNIAQQFEVETSNAKVKAFCDAHTPYRLNVVAKQMDLLGGPRTH